MGLKSMNSELSSKDPIPSFIPSGERVANDIAKNINGVPTSTYMDTFFGIPTTAHILGGATMGDDINSGVVDKNFDPHETLLAWTGFLSKAPENKVVICQPNTQEIALMGELSAETLQLRGVRGYIVDGGARDLDFILKIDYPVWSKFYTPKDMV